MVEWSQPKKLLQAECRKDLPKILILIPSMTLLYFGIMYLLSRYVFLPEVEGRAPLEQALLVSAVFLVIEVLGAWFLYDMYISSKVSLDEEHIHVGPLSRKHIAYSQIGVATLEGHEWLENAPVLRFSYKKSRRRTGQLSLFLSDEVSLEDIARVLREHDVDVTIRANS